MKKMILLFVTLGLYNTKGQTATEAGPPAVSARAGYLSSTLKGSDAGKMASDGNINSKNGFMVGVSVDNPINSHIGFKHEIFYQNTGAHFSHNINHIPVQSVLQMHNVRLNPFSLAYRYHGFQIIAGPYINMLAAATMTAADAQGNLYQSTAIFGSDSDDQQDAQYLQKMDYGLAAGGEYRFGFGGIFGVQFSRGFASIFDNSHSYHTDPSMTRRDLKIYNQSFAIFAGYEF